MVITELPFSLGDLKWEAGPPRSEGLHLSTVLRSLAGKLDPRYADTGPIDPNLVEPGFAYERLLEQAFMARRMDILRPGEIYSDGITMSPDGVDAREGVLEEFKYTSKSSKGCPADPKFRIWIWQIQAYARALGTTRARLRVFFCREQFTPLGPARMWEMEFSQLELETNWAMVVRHAKQEGMLR